MTKQEQVYGGSLYDLALEEGLTDAIGEELEQVIGLLDAEPAYWQFLSTLSIPKDERCSALDEALRGKIQPYLLNFLKILCENGTIRSLKGCAAEYRRRYDADNGIVEICAVTAVELKPALRQALQEKLEKTLNKTVRLKCRVDAACLGGVRLELPGRQLDGTVKQRLDTLSAMLKNAAV
jgi:F-type H+-transporting ATPase subunit delta